MLLTQRVSGLPINGPVRIPNKDIPDHSFSSQTPMHLCLFNWACERRKPSARLGWSALIFPACRFHSLAFGVSKSKEKLLRNWKRKQGHYASRSATCKESLGWKDATRSHRMGKDSKGVTEQFKTVLDEKGAADGRGAGQSS